MAGAILVVAGTRIRFERHRRRRLERGLLAGAGANGVVLTKLRGLSESQSQSLEFASLPTGRLRCRSAIGDLGNPLSL